MILKAIEYGLVDSDVNVTVFDGDSIRTGSEKFNLDLIVLQYPLNHGEGVNSARVVLICFG